MIHLKEEGEKTMDNPKVEIYTITGSFIGSFDDEPLEKALEIIKEHVRRGNVVLVGDDLEDFSILKI